MNLATLRAQRTTLVRMGIRLGVIALVIDALGLLCSRLDRQRDLKHLKVGFLSGSAEGNYHAIVDRLAARAAPRHGHIENLTSTGSVDNLTRLESASNGCSAHFALVQDGLDWPDKPPLLLIGRLPRAESVLFLGKDADKITE